MIKVECNNDELKFKALEGRPLQIVVELQFITVEAIRMMTKNEPESIRKFMVDMYADTLKDSLKELL